MGKLPGGGQPRLDRGGEGPGRGGGRGRGRGRGRGWNSERGRVKRWAGPAPSLSRPGTGPNGPAQPGPPSRSPPPCARRLPGLSCAVGRRPSGRRLWRGHRSRQRGLPGPAEVRGPQGCSCGWACARARAAPSPARPPPRPYLRGQRRRPAGRQPARRAAAQAGRVLAARLPLSQPVSQRPLIAGRRVWAAVGDPDRRAGGGGGGGREGWGRGREG